MLTRKEAANCCAILRRIVYRDGSPLSVSDMDRMREIIAAHGMDSMVDCADDPALLPVRDQEKALIYIMYRFILRDTVRRVFQEMEKRGIQCAVLKGEAISECYPPDVIRVGVDVDLYLPGKQREAFGQMMQELGFRLQKDVFTGQLGVDDYFSPHPSGGTQRLFPAAQRLAAEAAEGARFFFLCILSAGRWLCDPKTGSTFALYGLPCG